MTVVWDVASYRLVDIDRRFRVICSLQCSGEQSDDRGSILLWNVGKYLPPYTVQHRRRHSCSYSSPWEPYIASSQKKHFLDILAARSSEVPSHRPGKWIRRHNNSILYVALSLKCFWPKSKFLQFGNSPYSSHCPSVAL